MKKFIVSMVILLTAFSNNIQTAHEQKSLIDKSFHHRPLTDQEIFEIHVLVQNREKFIRNIQSLEQHPLYPAFLTQQGKDKIKRNKKFLRICNDTLILIDTIGVDAFNYSRISGQLFLEAIYLYREIPEIKSEKISPTINYNPVQTSQDTTSFDNLSDEEVNNLLSDLMDENI